MIRRLFALALVLAAVCSAAPLAQARPGLGRAHVIRVLTPGSQAPASQLVPGSGWQADIATPAAIGNSADFGYSAPVVSAFDAVPFQTYAATAYVTVLADHHPTDADVAGGLQDNVAKVSCAVDGGAFLDVTTRTANPITGTVGFIFPIIPSNFPHDGLHEMRCVSYPTTGIPDVLQGPEGTVTSSFFFNTNANGTLPARTLYVANSGSDSTGDGSIGNPYATASKALAVAPALMGGDIGGLTVCLKEAGNYTLAASGNFNSASQWVTVKACGVDPSLVVINSVPGATAPRLKRAHYTNLTLTTGLSVTTAAQAKLWLDTVTMSGPGKIFATSTPHSGFAAVWGTDSDVGNFSIGLEGANVILNRHLTVHDIGADGFTNVKVVVDSTLTNDFDFIYGTGNVHSGSPCVDGISDVSGFQIGATIYVGSGSSTGIPSGSTVATIGECNGANSVRFTNKSGATFTGSVSADVLTVTSVTSGSLYVGQPLNATNFPVGTFVSSFISGAGNTGTYRLSASLGTISSESITGTAPATLNLTAARLDEGYHSDCYQVNSAQSHIVLHGLHCNSQTNDTQGLFASHGVNVSNMSVVDSDFGHTDLDTIASSFSLGGVSSNVFLLRDTWHNGLLWSYSSGLVPSNISVVGNVCTGTRFLNNGTPTGQVPVIRGSPTC